MSLARYRVQGQQQQKIRPDHLGRAAIVRACVCVTLRTELPTFGPTAAALSLYLHGLPWRYPMAGL